jgi:ribose transport system substrate-binding protein
MTVLVASRGAFRSLRFAAKCCALVLAAATTLTAGANAQTFKDPLLDAYYAATKGKSVAFVPISLSFSIATQYVKLMQGQADRLGYKFTVRNPNWSVEKAVQAIDQLIAEKPDIIVSQPLDGAAENQLVKKAEAAGIYWIWLNLKGQVPGDAYVGANQWDMGRIQARLAGEYCKGRPTQNIAIITTEPTTYNSIAGGAGIMEGLKAYPDVKVVSTQSAQGDATKAGAIAKTVLKQYPDLCAFIGGWDGEDIGIVPAIDEAGLSGKVGVFTQGGGDQPGACDAVAKGLYTADVSYDIAAQGQDVNGVIVQLLQTKPKPGSMPFALFVENKVITKDSLNSIHCWNPN